MPDRRPDPLDLDEGDLLAPPGMSRDALTNAGVAAVAVAGVLVAGVWLVGWWVLLALPAGAVLLLAIVVVELEWATLRGMAGRSDEVPPCPGCDSPLCPDCGSWGAW